MKSIAVGLTAVAIAVALAALVSLLLSWPVMWLWNNCLISAVQGVHSISWSQAWGITILLSLLGRLITNK